MKLLSVKLGVISVIVGFSIFTNGEVWGKDWTLLKKTEDFRFYYDKRDITYSPKKIAKVWVRQVYTKKGKMDMIKLLGPNYGKLSYSINSLEFDCGAKLIHFLSTAHYSKNGDILDLVDATEKWESIPPLSTFDALYRRVCK